MIVIDTNVLAHALIEGPWTHEARSLLERHEWTAPELIRSEFQNVLASYGRVNQLAFEDCLPYWLVADNLLQSHLSAPDRVRALELAFQSGLTTYDTQFAALAEQHETVLVTEDKQLLDRFPQTTASIRQYLDPKHP